MAHLQMLFNLLDAVAPLAMRPGDIILKPLLDIHLPVSISTISCCTYKLRHIIFNFYLRMLSHIYFLIFSI